MTKIHFHVKGREAVTDKIQSLEHLRQMVLQMKAELKKPITCLNCGQEINLDEDHVCPDVIDAVARDVPPELQEPKKD